MGLFSIARSNRLGHALCNREYSWLRRVFLAAQQLQLMGMKGLIGWPPAWGAGVQMRLFSTSYCKATAGVDVLFSEHIQSLC